VNEFTVDYCRQVLMNEVNNVAQEKLKDNGFIKKVEHLSIQERFDMAKGLLLELGEYNNISFYRREILDNAIHLSRGLTRALSTFEGASFADFEYLVENASFCLFYCIITNTSFPVSLFVESERVRDYIEGDGANYLARSHWDERRDEIAAYYRSIVPNSEHMSDEMVLSVAGVKI
jgi:hypothetical protein